VLDLNLAGVSSADVIRRLRDASVPVVIATGYDEGAIDADLKDMPRCEKPFSAPALMERLAGLLS
jgi:DNA-binding response OmpR family regulator